MLAGSQLREVWNLRGRDRFFALQAQSPCASTGFWYIRPTPPALVFQRALVHRLLFNLPWGWDQVTWNEVSRSLGPMLRCWRRRRLAHVPFPAGAGSP